MFFHARTVLISSLFLLSSCASMIDGDMQQVKFTALGASDSRCTIMIGANSYKYTVSPPQTLWINKSREDMHVTCLAQGGRVAQTTVKSEFMSRVLVNTLNGGLGAFYDAHVDAMYDYPDEVVIDFGKQIAMSQTLPMYENSDALLTDRSSEIEYMGPDTPALSGDKDAILRRKIAEAEAVREEAENVKMDAEREARMSAVYDEFNGDKGTTIKPSAVKPPPAPINISKPIFPSTTSF